MLTEDMVDIGELSLNLLLICLDKKDLQTLIVEWWWYTEGFCKHSLF